MKEAFADLLEIRNLIALIVTIIFAVLALMRVIEGTDFMTVVLLVMGFLFGNKATKDKA